jgi:hypothetical protein
LEEFPITPLRHFLEILNDRKQSPALRFAAAKAAAPYMHPRLASIAVRAEPQHGYDLSELDDQELDIFGRILMKQRPDREDLEEQYKLILPPTVRR